MDHDLMLDPSWLLYAAPERTLEQRILEVEGLAREHRFDIFVPRALRRFLTEYTEGDIDERPANDFLRFYVPDTESVDLHELHRVLSTREELLRPFDPGAPRRTYVGGEDHDDWPLAHDHWPFAGYLHEALEDQQGAEYPWWWLREALFEEWVFLQEMSWIGSRTRKAFKTMVDAGAPCIEFGRRQAMRAVRSRRGLAEDDPIRTLDVLIASFKWVAAGGVGIVPRFFVDLPPMASWFASYFLNKLFVLIDP